MCVYVYFTQLPHPNQDNGNRVLPAGAQESNLGPSHMFAARPVFVTQ